LENNDIISSGTLELYALGLTSTEETRAIAALAEKDPAVKAEIEAIQNSLEAYASAYALKPKASVKEKLFQQINAAAESKTENIEVPPVGSLNQNVDSGAKVIPMNSGFSKWKWAAAASIALLLGSVAMNVSYYNKFAAVDKRLNETQEQLASLEKQNKDFKDDMSWPLNPNSVQVALKGNEKNIKASAKIFWIKETGDVAIDASNLPDPPKGMQYQFWGIVDGKPVSGGMIITNDKGVKYRMQKMRSFGKAEAFAISLEKEGTESPAPTEVVSMGTL
jgi:anti-sigma-K factor RskA